MAHALHFHIGILFKNDVKSEPVSTPSSQYQHSNIRYDSDQAFDKPLLDIVLSFYLLMKCPSGVI